LKTILARVSDSTRNHFYLVQRCLFYFGVKSCEVLLNQPAANPKYWLLDPEIVFLNHGAFGACPRHILEFQSEWRSRMERQPLVFLVREFETHLDSARAALAQFTGADAEDIFFVSNATTGVNTVLRSLELKSGDELVVTNQEYNASRNALDFVAERSGARVIVAKIPFPFRSEAELIVHVLECVTPRTRLALLDQSVSFSATGQGVPLSSYQWLKNGTNILMQRTPRSRSAARQRAKTRRIIPSSSATPQAQPPAASLHSRSIFPVRR
jgi:hypothetical protein